LPVEIFCIGILSNDPGIPHFVERPMFEDSFKVTSVDVYIKEIFFAGKSNQFGDTATK
jgi:hypothetical protein